MKVDLDCDQFLAVWQTHADANEFSETALEHIYRFLRNEIGAGDLNLDSIAERFSEYRDAENVAYRLNMYTSDLDDHDEIVARVKDDIGEHGTVIAWEDDCIVLELDNPSRYHRRVLNLHYTRVRLRRIRKHISFAVTEINKVLDSDNF